MYPGVLVLFAGIAAGVVGQWFGQPWSWAAIAILVVNISWRASTRAVPRRTGRSASSGLR